MSVKQILGISCTIAMCFVLIILIARHGPEAIDIVTKCRDRRLHVRYQARQDWDKKPRDQIALFGISMLCTFLSCILYVSFSFTESTSRELLKATLFFYDLQKCSMSIYFILQRRITIAAARASAGEWPWELKFLLSSALFALVVGWSALAIPSSLGATFCAVTSDVIGFACDLAMLYIFTKDWSDSILRVNGSVPDCDTVQNIHSMSRLILLTLFGMMSSFVVIVVLSSTDDNALIAGIMCCDEVINTICMALVLKWATPWYDFGCYVCDRAMIEFCIFVSPANSRRRQVISSSVPAEVSDAYHLLSVL